MSCDVAAAAFLLFTAAHPQAAPQFTPAVAVAPTSVSQEPLFRSIVGRAGALKGEVNSYRKSLVAAAQPLPLPCGTQSLLPGATAGPAGGTTTPSVSR